jgi:antitoxin ParD1/3/4
MSSTLNISLTDELRAFVDANCGDGTLYSTPSEFVRDLIRKQKERADAEAIRQGILDGYQDAIEGRTTKFEGDLRTLMRKRRT